MTQCTIADGAELSTDAYGQELQINFGLQKNLGARFDFDFTNDESLIYTSLSEIDVNHNQKFNLNSLDALVDWHPTEGDFFVSSGVIANRIKSQGISDAYLSQANAVKGASTYLANGATAAFDNLAAAPYLGLGWKTKLVKKKGWRFSTDVGVLYHGKNTVSLTNAGCLIANSGAIGLCQNADNGYPGGGMTDARANGLNYVPVFRAGVSFVF
jgi:hypothetical protein